MDAKQVQAIKDAKQSIANGYVTLWNARLDALLASGYTGELINHINAVDICGCPGPGSPVCGCGCPPPFSTCSNQNKWDEGINEMNKEIVELTKAVQSLKAKVVS